MPGVVRRTYKPPQRVVFVIVPFGGEDDSNPDIRTFQVEHISYGGNSGESGLEDKERDKAIQVFFPEKE